MLKLFPDVLKEEVSATTLSYRFTLDTDLKWFDGHFECRKLFPGVAQLFYVDHFSKELLEKNLPDGSYFVSGLQQFKFCCPMVPNDKVILDIDLDISKKRLRFTFKKDSQKGFIIASTGSCELSVKAE